MTHSCHYPNCSQPGRWVPVFDFYWPEPEYADSPVTMVDDAWVFCTDHKDAIGLVGLLEGGMRAKATTAFLANGCEDPDWSITKLTWLAVDSKELKNLLTEMNTQLWRN